MLWNHNVVEPIVENVKTDIDEQKQETVYSHSIQVKWNTEKLSLFLLTMLRNKYRQQKMKSGW